MGKIIAEDTEEAPLPPIEHVQPHGHVVEVDLPADPVHLPSPRETTQSRSEAMGRREKKGRDSAEAPASIMGNSRASPAGIKSFRVRGGSKSG